MYFHELGGPPCDRCGELISKLTDLRLFQGRRDHPSCFEEDFHDWLKREEEKKHTDPSSRLYFERVIDVLN